jgi:hypothetical protein
MAILTTQDDQDGPSSSYVFWAVVAVLILTVAIGIVVGLDRLF